MEESVRILGPRAAPGRGPEKSKVSTKNNDCVCGKGVIHSVATEDIPAGQSVMTVKEGSGRSRRWVTQVAPFQIHEKVKKEHEEAVELERATLESHPHLAHRNDAGGPSY